MKTNFKKKGGNVVLNTLHKLKMENVKLVNLIQRIKTKVFSINMKDVKRNCYQSFEIVKRTSKGIFQTIKSTLINIDYREFLLEIKKSILSINKETIRGWFSPHPKRPMTRNEVLLKSGKIALASAMVMSSCFIRKTEAQAATSSPMTTLQSGKSTSGDIFIGGNYIELGISSLGSFGSLANAPSYFHNKTASLPYVSRSAIGMIANENGWYSGKKSTTVDFFMPGIIDESWSVGINGNDVAIASAAANNGRVTKQNLDSGFKTVELRNDKNEVIGARTTGTMYGQQVRITQDILLGVDEKLYTTKIKLENISARDITDVRYMRAFDPDQNNWGGGSAHTHNHVQNVPGESAKVTSYGKVNSAPFIFYALDPRATAGYARNGPSEVFYFTDIYNSKRYMQTENTNGLDGPTNYMDGDIFLYFDIGRINVSESTELTYYSSLDADFKVATDKVDGKVVEDIITDKLPSVDKVEEVINKDTIKDEKPVVDEAKDRFDSLTDTGKDAVSDEAKDKLDAAVGAVDKVIKDDYLKPVIDAIDKLPDSSSDIVTKEDLDNLQAAQDAKDKYDELVNKGDKDEWLSGDKFESEDDYKEVVDAFEKLDGITKDPDVIPPSGGTITTHAVTINVTGERTETKEVGVISGKNYRYQVALNANERLEVVSGNATIEGANTVVVKDVASNQTVVVKVVNIIKDNILANLAKVLDKIVVTPGTVDTLQYLKDNATIDGSVITVNIPTISSDGLLQLTGTTIKITGIHKSQEDKNESFKIELSQGGQTISKVVEVVFEGDKKAPVIDKTTTQQELDKAETSKTLSFKISDEGVGIDEKTLKVTSYDDPNTPIALNKQLDGSYKFNINKSSGYEIFVKDYAGNETIETYIVTSIDTEAPIVEGVSNGVDYYLEHRVKITDQNLKTVTINGESIDSKLFVDGTYTFDKDAVGSYEIIASDGANTSKVTFSIIKVPEAPDARNEAIKVMREELKGQEALLTSEEYATLSGEINNLEGSINDGVVKVFEEEYAKIKDTIVTYDNRGPFDELLVKVNDGSKYYGTLTNDIAASRQAIVDAINAKLKPLRDEQAKVDSIKKDLDKYDPVQLKNTDQGVIKNKLDELKAITTTLIKDGTSNETLVAAMARVDVLLAVFAAYSTEVSGLDSKLSHIKGDNVKSSDLELINSVIKTLESYKASNSNRITADDIATIENKISKAKGFIARINEVAGIISTNSATIQSITVDNVTTSTFGDATNAYKKIEELKANMTDSEIAELAKLAEYITVLKNKVELDAVANIDDDIKTLTVNNVTEDSRPTIEKVVTSIDEVLSKPETTESQKTLLNSKKTTANSLIAQLDTVKTAVEGATGVYDNYAINTVKSSDKEAINVAGQNVNGVLTTYDKNLTANQKATLNNALTKATSLIARIDEVAGIINEINAIASLSDETLKITDKDKIELVLGYQDGIKDNLTDGEKTAVGGYVSTITTLQKTLTDVQIYLDKLDTYSKMTADQITGDVISNINELLKEDKYDKYLTDELISISKNQKEKMSGLIAGIDGAKVAIEDIARTLGAITADNVKTTNKAAVEAAKTLLDEFSYPENSLTQEQKDKLSALKTTVEKCLKIIEEIEELIKAIHSALELYPESTSNEDNLIGIKDIINNSIKVHKANLTESQIAEMNGLVINIDKSLENIKIAKQAYQKVIDSIDKSITVGNVKVDNLDDIENVLKLIDTAVENKLLSEDQVKELVSIQKTYNELKEQVDKVQTAVDGLKEKLDQYTTESVKTSDKEALETLKDEIATALDSFKDNLTEEQTKAINGYTDTIKSFTDKIEEVETMMAELKKDLEQFKIESVTLTDKDALDALKAKIVETIKSLEGNLTEEELSLIDGYKDTVTSFIDRIEEVETKINEFETTLEEMDVDTTTVTSGYRNELGTLQDAMNKFLEDFGGNLSTEQVTLVKGKEEEIDALVSKIDEVKKEMDKITEVIKDYTVENVKETDKDKLEELKDIITEVESKYETNLTETEKGSLTGQTEDIKELEERIEEVKKEVENIAGAMDSVKPENVTSDNKEEINDLKDKIDSFDKVYGDNITQEQGDIVQGQVDKIKDLEEVIQKVEETLKEIEDILSSMTTENIKETDKETLKELQDKIDEAKKELENNLSSSEKETLVDYTQDIVELDKKIEEVLGAIKDIESTLPELNKDNVVLDDKKDVNDLKDKIEDLNNNYGNNLTEDNKTVVNAKQEQVTELVDKIEFIEEVIKQIDELKKSDLTKPENIQKIKDLVDSLGSLSDKQKELLSVKDVEYLQDVVSNGVVSEIEDNLGAVRGDEGTVFIKGTKVEVKDVFETLDKELNDVVQKDIENKYNDYNLIALYDVKLVYKDTYIQPDGKIKVVLELPADYLQYEDIQAVYVDDEGNVTVYPFEIIDGYIHIETDHLSYYGIIAKGKATSQLPEDKPEQPEQPETSKQPEQSTEEDVADTSDHTMIDTYALLGMLSVAGYLALKDRKYLNR